jgi:hypothetical protein
MKVIPVCKGEPLKISKAGRVKNVSSGKAAFPSDICCLTTHDGNGKEEQVGCLFLFLSWLESYALSEPREMSEKGSGWLEVRLRPYGPGPSVSITISQPRGQLSSGKRACCRVIFAL